MNSKIELLKKLKALADSGVGGEKVNAEKMLKDLMLKHGISEDDISDEVLKRYKIPYKRGNEIYLTFLWQIVSLVLKERRHRATGYEDKKNRRIVVMLTTAEYIEITALNEFYVYHLQKDLDLFYLAFLQKNKLLAAPSDNDKKVTNKELEKYLKAQMLAEGLDKHEYLKQIESEFADGIKGMGGN